MGRTYRGNKRADWAKRAKKQRARKQEKRRVKEPVRRYDDEP